MMNLNPDDPRLTAYVLGELDEAERAEVEAILEKSPEARKEVEEIRSTVERVTMELGTEPLPALSAEEREKITAKAEQETAPVEQLPQRRRRWIPSLTWRGWAMAASVLVAVIVGIPYIQDLRPEKAETGQKPDSTVTYDQFLPINLADDFGVPAQQDTDSWGRFNFRSEDLSGVAKYSEFSMGTASSEEKGGSLGANGIRDWDVRSFNNDENDYFMPQSNARNDDLDSFVQNGNPNVQFRNGRDSMGTWTSVDPSAQAEPSGNESVRGGIPGREAGVSDDGDGRIDEERDLGLVMIDGFAGIHPSDPNDTDSTRVMTSAGLLPKARPGGSPAVSDLPDTRLVIRNGAKQQAAFAENIEYDGRNGTTSNGDILRVGEGPVPSEIAKYHDRAVSGVRFRLDEKDYVDVYGTPAQGSTGQTVNVAGQVYTFEWKGKDMTGPVEYTSSNPVDPFRSVDNDGDGLIDEIVDANGNTFTVQPVPKPEQLGGTEAYDRIYENPFVRVVDNPLSTFSIDVDTASYANVRRFINEGRLPPPDAVRIEEMINYFTYDYEPPVSEHPFAAHVEVAGCPWNLDHRLVRIGLKGMEVDRNLRPASNLVFLLDVSGSMDQPDKLPLVQKSMKKLVEHLAATDRVAIVVYAGASGLVLPSTSCDDQQAILDALGRLQAGGSTHGSAGIQLAYDTATQSFIEGGVNRVILCTDGDFNVGITDRGQLVRLIEEKAKTGVFLSVLGFGTGNLKDSQMEQLADKGNGNYAYIDSLKEGEKVLVEEMGGTLVTIAKDVKIQIEFNPGQVTAYRLIGYENRMLKKEDFNDDTKDAGEIGAGHTVTALYEVITADRVEDVEIPDVDKLRYRKRPGLTREAGSLEMLNLKLRYKEPDEDTSKLIEQPVMDSFADYSQASDDFKFAASVAAFGMILRGSQHSGNATLDMIEELADEGKGTDAKGYRAEFIELVRKAKNLPPSR